MLPTPLYQPASDRGAYQLRYSWTGWPSQRHFDERPIHLIEATKPHWERDGLRVLESRWTEQMVQVLFSAKPEVAPELVAARAKGRLDHALRQDGLDMPFSRKVAVRAVGDNTRRDVEAYLERQVSKARFVDPRFAAALDELIVVNPHVDLSQPTETARGRYWYNLHLVLVVDGRVTVSNLDVLRRIRDGTIRIASKKGHGISRLSVMPDHLHAALRGNVGETPLQIVFAYQNNLAFIVNQGRIWSDSFYVGTFGEYTTHVVRERASV
jgi:REP element-mobilizing transposase RayT